MVGNSHDASSCSTTGSELDGRKRPNQSEKVASSNCKPYECRFCPMKFAKSQALGGHMNRHRQEREREQVMNARKLLMQQDLSCIMMPGQNNAHLQRSSSEGSLKDVNIMGMEIPEPSSFRGGLQSNVSYNASLVPPMCNWNLATILEHSQHNMANPTIDGMMPTFQSHHHMYASPVHDASPYMMMHPQLASLSSSHDLVNVNIPFTVDNKTMSGSAVAYNNDNNNNGIINHHNLEEDTSVLATNDECPNLIPSPSPSSSSNKFLLTHHGEGGSMNVKRTQHLDSTSQALIEDFNSGPPNNINNSSDLFYTYSVPREISMTNTCLDFNLGPASHDQMDGLWLLGGNAKTTHDGTCAPNVEDSLHFGLDYPPSKENKQHKPLD